jgi:hypothetical protein
VGRIKWAGAAAGDVGTERVHAATQPERTSEQSDRYQRVKKAGRAQSRSFSNLRRCNCEWLAQPQRRAARRATPSDPPHAPGGPAAVVAATAATALVAAVAAVATATATATASCLPIYLPIHVQHRQPCGSSSNAWKPSPPARSRQLPAAALHANIRGRPGESRPHVETGGPRWSLFQPSWPPPALGPFQAQSNGHGI